MRNIKYLILNINMMKLKILLGIALFAVLLIAGPTFAQSETTTTETSAVIATDTVKNTVGVIGPWGIFWQEVKEQFALLTTIDPVTKIEKMAQFAQERMYVAEVLAEKSADNPVLQKRAQLMMEKAERFITKVDDQKEKALAKEKVRAERVLQRTAEQVLERQTIIDKIQEKLAPENMQKMEELRLRGLENSQRLVNAINNENISTTTKEHLQEVKVKIEEHLQEVKTFLEEKKALLEKVQNGDEAAIEELRKLRMERAENRIENKEKIQGLMQEKKEVREQIHQEIEENIGQILEQNRNRIQNRVNNKDVVICTQEAMICPDGSSVGRTGPNCEFAPCSGEIIE